MSSSRPAPWSRTIHDVEAVPCSAHRAEYPRVFEFAYSRAPPTCTYVARGLVLVLCEGSTKSFIKKSLKQKSYGAWKIEKVILNIVHLVRTALSSAVRAHPEVEVRSARSVRARTGAAAGRGSGNLGGGLERHPRHSNGNSHMALGDRRSLLRAAELGRKRVKWPVVSVASG